MLPASRRSSPSNKDLPARLDGEQERRIQSLEGRGAFDDFLDLQRNSRSRRRNAAALGQRFEAAEVLEGETTKLEIDRANIQRRLQDDHRLRTCRRVRRPVIAKAISHPDDRQVSWV